MFLFNIGGVFHAFTSRGLGQAVQRACTELREKGEAVKTEADALRVAAKLAPGLPFHFARVATGPCAMVGYFGEQKLTIGEVKAAGAFST